MPSFSVVVLARDEAKTLPRLVESLARFKALSGEIIVLDTGSTDGTPEVGRSLGCKVEEVRERFVSVLDPVTCGVINQQFVVDGEPPVVKAGDRLFDFASARNYAASLATNDMISMPDCDEVYTNLDIAYIDAAIARGVEQMEFNFVFAHDSFGQPAIKFLQCKMYDRRRMHWDGIVHEVLQGEAKREVVPESVLLLEHWQNPEQGRGQYLVGLATELYRRPEDDRRSHYFARELLWTGRPKSAIREFKRHIAMDKWPAERAQSMIFLGDAYGMLNIPDEQVEWYRRAFHLDPTRREALLRLSEFYRHNDRREACAAYAAAALQIPWHGFYANHVADYREHPHALLYWARGWMGDVQGAQEHILKALDYQPYNPEFLRDTKYYFEYADQGIEGWMSFRELQWLYETAKKMTSIAEVGSWKGRSTHALASGCKRGIVTAVDHFHGSPGEERQHAEAIGSEAVYEQFLKNTGGLTNLVVRRMSSLEVAAEFPDGTFDMVFLDGSHQYEDVKADIRHWTAKARLVLCGHDYAASWPGVQQAVDEELGGPDGVCDSIWFKWLKKPLVSVVVPTLGRPEKLNRLLRAIRENAAWPWYEIIVKPDQFPPGRKGVPRLLAEGVAEAKGDLIAYLGNDCVPEKDFLQLAVFAMIRHFPDLDGLVGLNDGYWRGEFATHWLASKKLLPMLGGEFFHTGYYHTGCDNELTERCRKTGKYVWCEEAKVYHDHPAQTGFRPQDMDDVYRLGYDPEGLKHDQELLRKRSQALGFALKEGFRRPDLLSLDELRSKVEAGESFTFVKLGDGEEACMRGDQGGNCDGHPYSAELGERLRDAFAFLRERAHVVEFPDQRNFNMLLHRTDSDLPAVKRFWTTVRNSPRPKVFVGPTRLRQAASLLRAKHMEVPLVNAYASYRSIMEAVLPTLQDDTIYVFSAGMPAKVMMADLLKANPKVTCIDAGSAFDPIFVGQSRTFQADQAILRNLYADLLERIPRRIFTIWLSDQEELPPKIADCIRTHKLSGYEHRLITLGNCWKDNEYVQQALKAGAWVKAVDYLRMHYLYTEGGIYLDADVEMVKPFPEEMLGDRLFCGVEHSGFVGNQVVGAEAGHPILAEYLDYVPRTFRGDDGLNFESSIKTWTDIVYRADRKALGMALYEPEYFFPYNHEAGTTKVTDRTIAKHLFLKFWTPPNPKVRTPQQEHEVAYWRSVRWNMKGVHEFFHLRQMNFGEQAERFPEVLQESGCGLDLGCGPGSIFEYHPNVQRGALSVIAVDALLDDYRSLELYSTHSRVKYRAMDGEALDFPDGSFDFVWCYNAIDHTPRPEQMIAEIKRVLKPGGRLYLLVYCDPALAPAHHSLWTEERAEAELAEFDLVRNHVFPYPKHSGYGWAGLLEKPMGYPVVHSSYDLRPRIGPLEGKKVLNVGIGSGQSGVASQLPYLPFTRLDHVEVHEPYIEAARRLRWQAKEVRFHHADVREMNLGAYDLVLFFDVLEHLPKEDSLALLAAAKAAVVFVPLEPHLMNDRQGADDIPSQDHLSLWTEQDLADVGYRTERIPGFHREHGVVYDALWAWKNPSECTPTRKPHPRGSPRPPSNS